MSAATDLRLTNDDVATMPDDGNRYELIDGKLYVSSPPSIAHQIILVNIAIPFANYLREFRVGEILPGVGVIFDDYNGVIPDLVVATHDKMTKTVADGRFQAAPDIVIEIISPDSSIEQRDRGLLRVKRSLYASCGVPEYWIVDPKAQTVEIHRRNQAGDLESSGILCQTDQLTCPILPGFAVRVESLFV